MSEGKFPNLKTWYFTDDNSYDLTEQIARNCVWVPVIAVEADVYTGGAVPHREVIDVSYQFNVPAAYWHTDLQAITAFETDGWVCQFDTVLGVAIVVPAGLTVSPIRQSVSNQSGSIRCNLAFRQLPDDRSTYHVAPGLDGTKKFSVTLGSGATTSDLAVAADTAVALSDADVLTITAVEQEI